MKKLKKSKAENRRSGGRTSVCHTEHALCVNFLLSSSWQQRQIWEAGIHHREETRAEETLRRIPFKRRNYDAGDTLKVVLLRLYRLF